MTPLARDEATQDARDEGFDEGRESVLGQIVCSVCGTNHDLDESFACDGCDPIRFDEYVARIVGQARAAEQLKTDDIDELVTLVERELQHPDGFHVSVILDVYRSIAARAKSAEGQARDYEELQRELDEAKSISFARETKAAVWQGRAERYEKALRKIDYRTNTNDPGALAAVRSIAIAALAGVGVTDNERTAEELHHIAAIKDTAGVRVWIDGQQSGEPAGERTADSSAGEVVARTAPADAPEEAVTLSGPSGLDASSAPAERTAGTGPTAAEHADVIENALLASHAHRHGAPFGGCSKHYCPDARPALAALVALADRQREALRWLQFAMGWEAFRPVRGTNEMMDVIAKIEAVLAGGAGDE